MNRRNVMFFLGALSLGGTTLLWRTLASLWRPGSAKQPGGEGLPAASTLGLHKRILTTPDLQELIAKGVAWLDKHAASRGVVDFAALDEAGRLAAIDAAFASKSDGTQQFLLALRLHLGTAYYSEPAIKSAFAYTGPPQPDGFADFQERPA
jgi:Gluconate 2-dehydrogenase subunit 3